MLMLRSLESMLRAIPKPFHDVLALLMVLYKPGEVIELRVTEPRHGYHELRLHGFFNAPLSLIQAVIRLSSGVDVTFSVNAIRRDLIHAAFSEIRWADISWPARDSDISRRAALVIPFRPVHEGAYPATIAAATDCRDFLTAHGWPAPVLADDGDGALLIYTIDLPNTDGSTQLVQAILATLSARFNDADVRIATSAFQPDLFVRLFGTPNVTTRRPSAILHLPDSPVTVATHLLYDLLPDDDRPKFSPSNGGDGNSVSRFIIGQCSPAPDTWTPTGTLYDAYCTHCFAHNLAPLPIAHFARQLIAAFGLEPDRRKVNSKVTRGFWGIRLR